MLTVSGLRAGYGATVILEDIDLILPERGALAVLGRNGVGKTTLLATLMGRTTRHAGAIDLRGQSIETLPVHRRAKLGLGYVPQTREIFPSLTVEENLTVAGRPGGPWSLRRVYQLFPRLEERRGNMGNQLSGGEQQMLAIGRALMGNPAVLLLDEPLEGLAPIIVDGIMLAIQALITNGLTIILVEQSAKRALNVTQTAIVLNRGQIAWKGQSRSLLEQPEILSRLLVEGSEASTS